MWGSARVLVVVLVAILATARLSAQEADGKKQVELPFELQDFWLKDAGVNTLAWAACMGQSPPAGGAWNPWGVLGGRVLMHHPKAALANWQFIFDEALPLWHRYVEVIQDGRPLPSIERKEINELRGSDWGMYLAMIQAIDRSHTATPDMFIKSAAANDHVGYKHLHNKPGQYRGQVVTVTGKITRVEKFEALRHVTSDIQFIYATEIQGPFKNEPPYAVLFTQLPDGVPYNKKIDMEVTFHGYFLAHVLFPGDPKKNEKNVTCPYLIGKTLIVNRDTPAPVEPGSYSYDLIVGSVGAIVCVLNLHQFEIRLPVRRSSGSGVGQ